MGRWWLRGVLSSWVDAIGVDTGLHPSLVPLQSLSVQMVLDYSPPLFVIEDLSFLRLVDVIEGHNLFELL